EFLEGGVVLFGHGLYGGHDLGPEVADGLVEFLAIDPRAVRVLVAAGLELVFEIRLAPGETGLHFAHLLLKQRRLHAALVPEYDDQDDDDEEEEGDDY